MGQFARLLPSRGRTVIVAALVTFGLAAAVPPHRGAPAPSGPPTVTDVWPAATLFRMPAATPDGRAYAPLAVLADGRSVGTATTPGGATVSLVLVNGEAMRTLRADRPAGAASFDAFATDAAHL